MGMRTSSGTLTRREAESAVGMGGGGIWLPPPSSREIVRDTQAWHFLVPFLYKPIPPKLGQRLRFALFKFLFQMVRLYNICTLHSYMYRQLNPFIKTILVNEEEMPLVLPMPLVLSDLLIHAYDLFCFPIPRVLPDLTIMSPMLINVISFFCFVVRFTDYELNVYQHFIFVVCS